MRRRADDETQEMADLLRAGLWAVFAQGSLGRPWAGPSAPNTAAIVARAAGEADGLLAAFDERFSLYEMLGGESP